MDPIIRKKIIDFDFRAKRHNIPFMFLNLLYSEKQQEEKRWANDEFNENYTFFNPVYDTNE